jgi:hypothetical protein
MPPQEGAEQVCEGEPRRISLCQVRQFMSQHHLTLIGCEALFEIRRNRHRRSQNPEGDGPFHPVPDYQPETGESKFQQEGL